MISLADLKQINNQLWEIPKTYRADMRVPARIYVSRDMLEMLLEDKSLEQLVNVTTLPGIQGFALAMPDIHLGYGFPIGGVAAISAKDGVISPGGVGYDINCGVRLLTSSLKNLEVRPYLEKLMSQLQRDVPSGVGQGGFYSLDTQEINQVLNTGVQWALKRGLASAADLDLIEDSGCMASADAGCVSEQAKSRGAKQLGTIGAGNHFLEVQEVLEIFDKEIGEAYGLFRGQVVIMMHTGSRGLGHQTCTDYVKLMDEVMQKYKITLPDRELACAPLSSDEGSRYFKAMSAAANFAWTNRQVITHQVREAWKRVFGSGELEILYDVAHNIAKIERYHSQDLLVHRKGATRAFGPDLHETPLKYRKHGQPVLIPGSMGTFSYVLAGTKFALENTFGSSCHGAGRRLSRRAAKKSIDYTKLRSSLEDYGVVVRAGSNAGLLEEAPQAYKDIDAVIDVVAKSGIAKIVAKLKPIGVVKG